MGSALACASSPAAVPAGRPLPEVVVLRIDRVDVAPTRPGTNDRWDGPVPESDNGAECSLPAFGTGLFSPVVGKGVGLLCNASSKTPQAEKDATNPDLQLRLAAGVGRHFDSYFERDALSHVFGYQVVVPVAAIPPTDCDWRFSMLTEPIQQKLSVSFAFTPKLSSRRTLRTGRRDSAL